MSYLKSLCPWTGTYPATDCGWEESVEVLVQKSGQDGIYNLKQRR